jgi:CRP/FNR family cyclic AMP-dependent transcriptional regulator
MDGIKHNNDHDCFSFPVRTGSPFCGKLNDDALTFFMKHKKILNFEKRKVIFYRGHPNQGVYLLCSGSAKLLELSPEGKFMTTGLIFQGDLIDKIAFFNLRNHLYTAETLETSQVIFIKRAEFLSYLKKDRKFSIQIMELLSDEIEVTRERNRQLLYQNGRQRIAGILLHLGRKCGLKSDQGIVIPIEFKREELAELTGMTLESLVRGLSYFKKEQWIEFSEKKLIILAEEKLRYLQGNYISFLAK